MTVVTLYGKADCCLCDDARSAIEAMREGGLRFELVDVDIATDAGLLRNLGERIPVVEVDGDRISELALDEAAVRRRLEGVRA